ncbi:hypothetical protein ACQJBY_002941 [Aegilops geniculata]
MWDSLRFGRRACSSWLLTLFRAKALVFGVCFALGESTTASGDRLIPLLWLPSIPTIQVSRVNMSIIQWCGALKPGEEAGAFFDDGSGRLSYLQVLELLATACLALSSFPLLSRLSSPPWLCTCKRSLASPSICSLSYLKLVVCEHCELLPGASVPFAVSVPFFFVWCVVVILHRNPGRLMALLIQSRAPLEPLF